MGKRAVTTALTGLAAGLLFSTGTMAAAMLDFETSLENSAVEVVGGWDVSVLGGLELTLSDTLADTRFSLAEEESHTFDFFDIKLPEVGTGDTDIRANLAFTRPGELDGTGEANAFWLSILFFSLGDLKWLEQPGLIEMDNGDRFYLAFSDLQGAQLGQSATVTATVTAKNIANTNRVPAPAPLALLSMGLLGLAFSRRRQKPGA
ncbi:MAG: PEP-CTERM sorting domain-containing protein [Oleiphilaceae bacterium]|nr:PEP-CTERM sorting domain-containing protein [Oleiphilaceae bacterium]